MHVGSLLRLAATINGTLTNFVVDTGASLSILPFSQPLAHLIRPTAVTLSGPAGDKIRTYGEVDINLGIRRAGRVFKWTFLVANVVNPLLGIDFLIGNKLLVDCASRQLIDCVTNREISLCPSDVKPTIYLVNNISNVDPRAISLLNKYPILTSPLRPNSVSKSPCKITHFIRTGNNNPVSFRSRPLTGEKLKIAKEEFQFLLDAGVIRRSESPWASPLHLVPKREFGKWRTCVDFRLLNTICEDDKYPIPNLNSLLMSLHGKRIFSKLDLQRAYLQIDVNPSDIPKTAVITPFGLFEFLKMPYGMKNAGATFQRQMDSIFANVPNVCVYLDDILISSATAEQHTKDLNTVLSLLSDNNLRLAIGKCEFYKTSLNYLGYEVSPDGIRPPSDRVKVISDYPLPENSFQLRRFMGMLNFFRRNIPNFANIAFNVTELLRLNPKSKELTWPDNAKASFEDLKQALATCPTLSYPSIKATEYHLVTDSSNYAVGAALYQMINTVPTPVGFFSKKLSVPQRTYSTYDRELLGAYLATLHFKPIIDGHSVVLFTDHKPIVSAFYSSNTARSDRQQRQLSFLSEYITHMQYIKGNNNVVADCLSRPICNVVPDAFDLPAIAILQSNDHELSTFKEQLKQFYLSDGTVLWCDTSKSTPRPFVPLEARLPVISSLHNLSHPGFKGTSNLVKDRFYWREIDRDIKKFVSECIHCQQAKVQRHTKSPVETISAPADRFQTVHIDVVGPLPPAAIPSQNQSLPFRYLLTCIDRATRWAEAIPITDHTASSIAISFISGWVSRFGVPLKVITDRGAEFMSDLFSELSSLLGFHHIRTCSYHPNPNGIVERLHRTLKAAIMARKDNWYQSIPIVLLGMRMAPSCTGYSPFTAVTGALMLCPHPIVSKDPISVTNHDTIKTMMDEMQKIDFSNKAAGVINSFPNSYIPKDLNSCSKVWLRVDRVRKSLEAPYTGPYEVVSRHNKFFVLRLPQGESSVSIDRLKVAKLPDPVPVKKTNIVDPVPTNDTVLLPNDVPNELPNIDQNEPPVIVPPSVRSRSGRTIRFNPKPDYNYY